MNCQPRAPKPFFIRNVAFYFAALGMLTLSTAPQMRAEAAPVLTTPDSTHMKEVKITLKDCLELGLRNNLELDIERINPKLADAEQRIARGEFEPTLQMSADWEDSTTPRDPVSVQTLKRDDKTGLPIFKIYQPNSSESQYATYESAVAGKLPLGTQWRFSNRAEDQQTTFNDFKDRFDSRAELSLSQPLLRGFGTDVNLAELRIARKQRDAADSAFVFQVSRFVTDVYNAYYDLVFARDDLLVQRESLALADQLVQDNRDRLDAGMMSPLDISQARSEAAARLGDVYRAERAELDVSNRLKRLIYRDLERRLNEKLVPAEVPPAPTFASPKRNIETALVKRADVAEQLARVEQTGIRLKKSQNALLPSVDARGSYAAVGRDDSFSESLHNTYDANNPDWTVGVVVSVPLGMSTERGQRDQAKLLKEQAFLRLKQLEQDVIVEVDNAAGAVVAAQKRLDAAREGARYARESVNAEQERLNAGASTTFVVSQLQRDFARAQTSELLAMADLQKSLAELARVEGTALEANHITIHAVK